MQRFRRLSATPQTVSSQLFPDERIKYEQDGVGLYDGKEKSLLHDNGTLYLTSHRMIYLDAAKPLLNSCFVDLGHVRQTEYWAGLIKSSPKITLVLGEKPKQSLNGNDVTRTNTQLNDDIDATLDHPAAQTWICRVCAYRNAMNAAKCQLCGVSYQSDFRPPSAPKSLGAPESTSSSMYTPEAPTPSRTDSPGAINEELQGVQGLSLESETTNSQRGVQCPACTFLNHPSMMRCEMCDSPLQQNSAEKPSSTSTPIPKSSSPAPSQASPNSVRLSFRKGGISNFYNRLKATLNAKEWDYEAKRSKRSLDRFNQANAVNDASATFFGIDGILRSADMSAKERREGLQDAVKDLDQLMENAQEMVTLAKDLNSKLLSSKNTGAQDAVNQDDVTFIRTSLLNLGFLSTDVITEDMIEADQRYHEELAKELGHVLSFVMGTGENRRGIIPLDEVYCIWNRARGVALVSPRDLVRSVEYLPKITQPPIAPRTFKSGRKVLYIQEYDPEHFKADMLSLLSMPSVQSDTLDTVSSAQMVDRAYCISNFEVSQRQNLSPGLATEMLEALEDEGVIVRDEASVTDDIYWWLNLLLMPET